MNNNVEELIEKYTNKANEYLKKSNECEDHIMCNQYKQSYYIYMEVVNDLKNLN